MVYSLQAVCFCLFYLFVLFVTVRSPRPCVPGRVHACFVPSESPCRGGEEGCTGFVLWRSDLCWESYGFSKFLWFIKIRKLLLFTPNLCTQINFKQILKYGWKLEWYMTLSSSIDLRKSLNVVNQWLLKKIQGLKFILNYIMYECILLLQKFVRNVY